MAIFSDHFVIDADSEGKESPVTTELLLSEGEGIKIMLILNVNQF